MSRDPSCRRRHPEYRTHAFPCTCVRDKTSTSVWHRIITIITAATTRRLMLSPALIITNTLIFLTSVHYREIFSARTIHLLSQFSSEIATREADFCRGVIPRYVNKITIKFVRSECTLFGLNALIISVICYLFKNSGAASRRRECGC